MSFSLRPSLATVSTIATPQHFLAVLSTSFPSLLFITTTLCSCLTDLFVAGLLCENVSSLRTEHLPVLFPTVSQRLTQGLHIAGTQ